MTEKDSRDPSSDHNVDRGQRIADAMQMTDAHDGKARARFVRPKRGELAADMADSGRGPSPVTTEDVVETPPAASAWEAIEDDHADPATPARRGRDPARTQTKE